VATNKTRDLAADAPGGFQENDRQDTAGESVKTYMNGKSPVMGHKSLNG
jgi:hypothetical protein